MTERLDLCRIPVEVSFKDIKNVHLSVHPPNGRVRIEGEIKPAVKRLFG